MKPEGGSRFRFEHAVWDSVVFHQVSFAVFFCFQRLIYHTAARSTQGQNGIRSQRAVCETQS